MDALTVSAASGLRSRIESLEMLANNLANAGTAGYKTDREFYSLYIAPEAADPSGADRETVAPLVERPWTDFSQGMLQPTGNPLDMAISGKGFFVVKTASGPAYTRNGNFHLSATGELVTTDGYPVLEARGGTLQAQPGTALEVGSDGSVRQNGSALGQLQIVNFPDSSRLTKMGNSYFRNPDAKVQPTAATGVEVHQGTIENANVNVAESAVRLVGIMRQFEMLQKAVSMAGDADKQVVQEVARVGS